jgi:hypothetical protein
MFGKTLAFNIDAHNEARRIKKRVLERLKVFSEHAPTTTGVKPCHVSL